ncbi:MAG: NFACT RNA binding domain-containing protein [Bacteroidota bacterium]|nr:NFACT RNA binding domain-containing protein [Bacteroidota bacterium]
MINHWLTLAALIEELHRHLDGAAIEQCYRTQEGELCVAIESAAGRRVVVLQPAQPIRGIYIHRANPPRIREPILPQLQYMPVRGIRIAPANRIVTFALGDVELVFIAIPGTRLFCVVRDPFSCQVVTAVGTESVPQRWELPESPLPDPLDYRDDSPLSQVLSRSRILLASPYAVHFCHQQGLEPSLLWGSIALAERQRIIDQAYQYRQHLIEQPTPVLVRQGTEQLFLLAPVFEAEGEVEHLKSVEQGVYHIVRLRYRAWALERARTQLHRRIQGELQRIEHAKAALQQDVVSAPEADQLEQWGHLLIAHPQRHQRGIHTLSCQGWDGHSVDITLDPSLTVLENAEKFFARARKIRRAAKIAQDRLVQLSEREQILRDALAQLDTIQSSGEANTLEQRLYPPRQHPAIKLPVQGSTRFREFPLPMGYVLLVGKDARSNEELTYRVARPHDVWLHARGVEGAHGLIPIEGRTLPPMPVIESAAAIVAYYSGARNARYVPVSWTQRKYLRKPKRQRAGAVEMLRESVVFVEPRHPASSLETESNTNTSA